MPLDIEPSERPTEPDNWPRGDGTLGLSSCIMASRTVETTSGMERAALKAESNMVYMSVLCM
jgi:hypothetical protein